MSLRPNRSFSADGPVFPVRNVLLDVMDSTGSVSLENAGAGLVGAGRRVISVFLRSVVFMGPVRNQASASVSAAGRERAAIETSARVHPSPAGETPPVWRRTEEDMRVFALLETDVCGEKSMFTSPQKYSSCKAALDISRCQNGGSCSASRCLCPAGFTGTFCELHVRKLKLKARVKAQRFSSPALHKLLRPVPVSAPLVTRSQILCFAVLGLLTCLVVLVTTGLIFFPRCEVWVANRRYRRLVQENQRNLLQHAPVNIILPEKIRLSAYGPHYTSI
ncbi:unnamed protein product [Leuciscus chuanchicus]